MNNLKSGLLLPLLLPAHALAQITVYFDEAAYTNALIANGYTLLYEGFEDDIVWADSRTTISNPSSTPQVSMGSSRIPMVIRMRNGATLSATYPTQSLKSVFCTTGS